MGSGTREEHLRVPETTQLTRLKGQDLNSPEQMGARNLVVVAEMQHQAAPEGSGQWPSWLHHGQSRDKAALWSKSMGFEVGALGLLDRGQALCSIAGVTWETVQCLSKQIGLSQHSWCRFTG